MTEAAITNLTRFPRRRMRTPGASCCASQGWLKNVAGTVDVPSEIFTVRIVSRPRRRELTLSTSPAITTSSSPPPSEAIRTSGAAAS